jgi:hypothetical protein
LERPQIASLHALEVEKDRLAATKFALIKSRLCGPRPLFLRKSIAGIKPLMAAIAA